MEIGIDVSAVEEAIVDVFVAAIDDAAVVFLAYKLVVFALLVVLFEFVVVVVAVLIFAAASADSTSFVAVTVTRATKGMIHRNCYRC